MSDLLSGPAMAAEMGMTYRQLDYWITQGWIKPTPIKGRLSMGSGHGRVFAEPEAKVARMFARLVANGWRPSDETALVARKLAVSGRAVLSGGLVLTSGGAR